MLDTGNQYLLQSVAGREIHQKTLSVGGEQTSGKLVLAACLIRELCAIVWFLCKCYCHYSSLLLCSFTVFF